MELCVDNGGDYFIEEREGDEERKEIKQVLQNKLLGDRAVSNLTLGTNFGLGGGDGIFEVSHFILWVTPDKHFFDRNRRFHFYGFLIYLRSRYIINTYIY